MMSYIYGIIHNVDCDKRLITIVDKQKLTYYYMSRSLYKRYSYYLLPNNFVYFKTGVNQSLHDGVKAYDIIHFIKIMKYGAHEPIIYYDVSSINKGVLKLLEKETYRLFLDLEFSMPPYNYVKGQQFTAEIIEYGFVLENSDGVTITTENGYIKPDNLEGLNERTYSFLGLNSNTFKKAKGIWTFYNSFKDVLSLYQPTIYVWGKNDYLMLDKFYVQHNLKPLTTRASFINLMQVMKNYYGTKEDIGLYHAYSLFQETPLQDQDHNALNDAIATTEIYKLFKEELFKKKDMEK